jgi:hypothetical protein
MASCKNNFLIGTAKLAAQQKIENVIAVCPVEHDLAYSEDDKNWVQKRQEAEQEALIANKNLTIMNTDLVFSEGPSHLLHFAAQSVAKGSIPASFLGQASFRPIHTDDIGRAIAHVQKNGTMHGQHAIRGTEEHKLMQIILMIEQASGKSSTQAKKSLPLGFTPLLWLEEFVSGITTDTNMSKMLEFFNAHSD